MRASLNLAVAFILIAAVLSAGPISGYLQTDLVSNVPGKAAHTDTNLHNPWGISFSSASPFWVSDNGTGKASLYNSDGVPQGLVVSMPAIAQAPTGQVFNSSSAFNADPFIFASEDGVIAGWRNSLGTTAEVLFDRSVSEASYKGLAIGSVGSNTYLYAANFHSGQIDVFPGGNAPALPGHFVDPTIPSGFAPFNIENLNGQLYVTYAKQGPTGDDVSGPGNGFVSLFDLNGNFIRRVASGGVLNSPWGLAIAPNTFGGAAGALLVGNFGDGMINAFMTDGTVLGAIADLGGKPIQNDGLWGLTFGNGGNGGTKNSLYLTAGLNDEADGLFARIDAVPEPWTTPLIAAGLALCALKRNRRGDLS
jgi:uncharacterized protein (TIGR03118 family)